METLLEVQNLVKFYGNKTSLTKAVNDISFQVNKGEFTAIMGASGSGKTTLLNCISTIDKATSGHVLLKGQDITKLKGNALMKFRREQLGFIFQDFNLLDTLNAFDNIALALQIQGKKSEEIKKRVREISEKLNVAETLKKYPYEMSGGQRQRIACARAIVTEPSYGGFFIVIVVAVPQQDHQRIVILDQLRILIVLHADNGESGIGHLSYVAHWQRIRNGLHTVFQRHIAGHHGGNDLGGQGRKNIGLYPAAQSVSQDHDHRIGRRLHNLHPVAAQLLAVLVDAAPT